MHDKLEILNELAFNLTPTTLAAIVADLNSNEGERFSHNLSMALEVMILQGEENCGGEFEQMVIEAEADRMPR